MILGCSTINETTKIKLKYIFNTPILFDYNFLRFMDEKGCLYFVISEPTELDSVDILSLDSLISDEIYELELIPVKKNSYLKSIVRQGPSSFSVDTIQITRNDTLVGDVYTSPNIIHFYYKK